MYEGTVINTLFLILKMSSYVKTFIDTTMLNKIIKEITSLTDIYPNRTISA